jgi:CelD/BcsL family acetyltransferase involved in cellulose biosynthesis
LPFTDSCAILADQAEDAARLVTQVRAALGNRIACADIRGEAAGVLGTPVAVRHVLPLGTDVEAVWNGCHRSQVRRNVGRAEREGVTVRLGLDPADLTEVFHGLHVLTRRRQGVPVQPKRFFRLLAERQLVPGRAQVLIAEHQGRPIAAMVLLRGYGTTIYKFGASDETAWRVRPNQLLMWRAISDACQAGDHHFDFGRTDTGNDGLRAFKASFGAVEMPLIYSRVGAATRGRPEVPGEAVSAAGARQIAERTLAAVIRRSPMWVGRGIGAALYRYAA